MSERMAIADELEKWCAVFYSKTGPCSEVHGEVQCLRCKAAAALRESATENLRLAEQLSAGGWDQHSKDARIAELEAERDRLRGGINALLARPDDPEAIQQAINALCRPEDLARAGLEGKG